MRERSVGHSGARGAVAAMAMTGLRRVTTALGLLTVTPPEEILDDQAPRLLRQLPPRRRPALVEGAHIGYGIAGGILFGLLPRHLRRRAWAGPAYGLLFWTLYEVGIAPALGLHANHRRREHLVLLADHLLYGVVVAGSPVPQRD